MKFAYSEAPLVAIEILSPTQSLTELITKSAQYFEDGVKSYWLVLPDLTCIYVFDAPLQYQFFSKHDTLVDEQLKLELDLQEVFKP